MPPRGGATPPRRRTQLYAAQGDLAVAAKTNEDAFVPGDSTLLDEVNTVEGAEEDPTLSADGLRLWFVREENIYVSQREPGEAFGVAKLLDELPASARGPEILEGPESRLYFTEAGGDLQVASCTAADACGPAGTVGGIDEEGKENHATLSADGNELIVRSGSAGVLVSFTRNATGDFSSRTELDIDAAHPELTADGTTLYMVVAGRLYVAQRGCAR
jgi:hypothetical protein